MVLERDNWKITNPGMNASSHFTVTAFILASFFVFQFVFIYISFFFLLLAKPFLYSSSHFIVLFSDHLPLLFLSYFVFFVLCLSSFLKKTSLFIACLLLFTLTNRKQKGSNNSACVLVIYSHTCSEIDQ